jgi:hypothetical protein
MICHRLADLIAWFRSFDRIESVKMEERCEETAESRKSEGVLSGKEKLAGNVV